MKGDTIEKEAILKNDNTNTTNSEVHANDPPRHSLLFYLLGLLVFTVLFLGMAAAQEILAGTSIPTSTVLLCTSLPFFSATLLAPYFIPLVSATIRIPLVTLLCTSGILMVAVAEHVGVKLTGVCLISLGCGIAETSFLCLTAFFDDVAIRMYCGGTGTGFAVGPFYYTALTTWMCTGPRTALLTTSGIPLIILLIFLYVNRSTKSHKPIKRGSASYTEITSTEEEQYDWKHKLTTVKRAFPLVVSLILGVTCEYLTVQGVMTTLAFVNSPFTPNVHYQYYFFCFSFGELFGRSYSMICHYLCSTRTVFTEKTWIFTIVMAANLLFAILASWYRFLPTVWPVFIILFEHGIAAGCLYLNTFAMAGNDENHSRGREFSRAFVSIGSGMGLTLAGFVGLVIEPQLRMHCLTQSLESDAMYCFTRQIGWNATSNC